MFLRSMNLKLLALVGVSDPVGLDKLAVLG